MTHVKKKTVLQELAVSLFLMLEFDPDTTARSLVMRIREKAADALQAAAVYTGVIGAKDVQKFLQTKAHHFTIDCGADIIKGDVIRFTEYVFDYRRKPPRHMGKRCITAEVTHVGTGNSNPILQMDVIASSGTWELPPKTEIRRTMKIIISSGVMRAPWDDEARREEIKGNSEQ